MCFHFSSQQIIFSRGYPDIMTSQRARDGESYVPCHVLLPWMEKDMAWEAALRLEEGMKGCQMWPGGLWK